MSFYRGTVYWMLVFSILFHVFFVIFNGFAGDKITAEGRREFAQEKKKTNGCANPINGEKLFETKLTMKIVSV